MQQIIGGEWNDLLNSVMNKKGIKKLNFQETLSDRNDFQQHRVCNVLQMSWWYCGDSLLTNESFEEPMGNNCKEVVEFGC